MRRIQAGRGSLKPITQKDVPHEQAAARLPLVIAICAGLIVLAAGVYFWMF